MAWLIRRTYKVSLPDGTTERRKCDHWTIQYRDAAGKVKSVQGYADKSASKQKAAELERALARGEQGLAPNPYRGHKARATTEHVKEYLADLRAAGRDDGYVYNAEQRLSTLIAECKWNALGDVEINSFLRWREQRRASGNPKGRGSKKGAGASASTLNQFLDTARAFLNWCAQTGRIEGVPVGGKVISTLLAGVVKVDGPKVRLRRALSDDQVTALLAAAPDERAIVYRTALATGLRRDELAQLVWGDLGLSAIPPYAQLRSEATKARRGDRIYLPQSLAQDLRGRRGEAQDRDPVFPAVPSIKTWRIDLAAAGIDYKDGMGRQADFHAGTRKTLCTRLHRSGKPLAVAMRVMRHTDARLTMVDYCDDHMVGLEAAVLPELTAAAKTDNSVLPVSTVAGGA